MVAPIGKRKVKQAFIQSLRTYISEITFHQATSLHVHEGLGAHPVRSFTAQQELFSL